MAFVKVINTGLQILATLASGWVMARFKLLDAQEFSRKLNEFILKVLAPCFSVWLIGVKTNMRDPEAWRLIWVFIVWNTILQALAGLYVVLFCRKRRARDFGLHSLVLSYNNTGIIGMVMGEAVLGPSMASLGLIISIPMFLQQVVAAIFCFELDKHKQEGLQERAGWDALAGDGAVPADGQGVHTKGMVPSKDADRHSAYTVLELEGKEKGSKAGMGDIEEGRDLEPEGDLELVTIPTAVLGQPGRGNRGDAASSSGSLKSEVGDEMLGSFGEGDRNAGNVQQSEQDGDVVDLDKGSAGRNEGQAALSAPVSDDCLGSQQPLSTLSYQSGRDDTRVRIVREAGEGFEDQGRRQHAGDEAAGKVEPPAEVPHPRRDWGSHTSRGSGLTRGRSMKGYWTPSFNRIRSFRPAAGAQRIAASPASHPPSALMLAQLRHISMVIITNPLLLFTVLSVFMSLAGIPSYLDPNSKHYIEGLGWIEQTLGWMARSTSPLSVFAQGLWLHGKVRQVASNPMKTCIYMVLKLVLGPALMMLLTLYCGLEDRYSVGLIIMTALPVGQIGWVLCEQYKIGAEAVTAVMLLGTATMLPHVLVLLQIIDHFKLFNYK